MAHPEALLISAALRQAAAPDVLGAGITVEHFHVHDDEWSWIQQYCLKHRRSPSKVAFKSKFPQFVLYRVDDVDLYVDEVREEHLRHGTISAVEEAVVGLREGQPTKAVMRGLQEHLVRLDMSVADRNVLDVVSDVDGIYADMVARVDRVAERGMSGVPTGFPTLDLLTGGPGPGDYWVVAARLGQGKTWSLIRMACAAMYEGLTVNYHSLEQSRQQIALRCHTFMSSRVGRTTFKHLDLQRGRSFDLLGYRQFLDSLREHFTGRLFVSDGTRGTVSPVTIAAQIEAHKPDIVFVDYLTLMDSRGDDWKAVANLSGQIKMLAVRYEVPIVVAAQINRAGVGRQLPGPEHLAQADAIGQDADCVVTLAQMSRRVIKMRLAKYRHGRDGDQWWCEFQPNTGKYEEISGDQAQAMIEEDRDDDDTTA